MPNSTARGSSVDSSHIITTSSRRLPRLRNVVPINFQEGIENELMDWYDWYKIRSTKPVHAMQLRQEREGPYLHQFIVFALQDNAGLFRIDRRMRPNEDAPLNSLKDEGIPAFDTIEPVASWDDPLFPASDCLISIEFEVDVHLALILKICRAIQAHPLARFYTLQRYNGCFFAQTIFLCMACGISDWVGVKNWLPEHNYKISQKEQRIVSMMSRLNSSKGLLELEEPIDEYEEPSDLCLQNINNILFATELTYKGYKFTLAVAQETSLPKLQREDIRELHIAVPMWGTDPVNFLRNKIDDSTQHLLEGHMKVKRDYALLQIYKYGMTRSIWEVTMKKTIFDFWPKFEDIVLEVRSVRESVSGIALTLGVIFATAFDPHPERGMQLGFDCPSRLHEFDSFGIRLSILDQLAEFQGKLKPFYNEIDKSVTNACLHSSEENMAIKINYEITDAAQETIPNFNPENMPQYQLIQLIHDTVFWWHRAEQEQVQEQEYDRDRYRDQDQDQATLMTAATILDMQEYLIRLIRTHSTRVEQHQLATNAAATDVASDISRAMDEIWAKLIE